jgi:surface antigen
MVKISLLVAFAVIGMTPIALARNIGPDGGDRSNTYSSSERNCSYDQRGAYRCPPQRYDWQGRPYSGRAGDSAYYRPGVYEESCRRGNSAGSTIFGAFAGGLAGGAVSRGNGGAIVGGAVLGGLLGNTLSREINCNDQPYAFGTYSNGLNGSVGRRYAWKHGDGRGYFQTTREFTRRGTVCREFTATNYRGRRELRHDGIACRAPDGHWRFD